MTGEASLAQSKARSDCMSGPIHPRIASRCVVSLNAMPCMPFTGDGIQIMVVSSVSCGLKLALGVPSALIRSGFWFPRARSMNGPQLLAPLDGSVTTGGDVVTFDGAK